MRCLLLLSAICVSDIWHLHNFEVTSVFTNLQFTIHTCMNICDWTFSIIYVYIERNNAVCIQVNVQHVRRCVPALYGDMDHSTVYIHVHNNSVYVHISYTTTVSTSRVATCQRENWNPRTFLEHFLTL